jgi:hypothetical protein
MSLLWGALGFVAAALIVREIAAYLPTIARWQINRGANQLPEEMRADSRAKWLAMETKLPGDLSKVLWGIGCNWFLAPQFLKPATPERVAKLVHFIFFVAYLRAILRDFIKGQFASPKQLRDRWLALKKFADQAIVMNDPNAPQPLLDLGNKFQRIAEIKQEMEKLAQELNVLRKNLWK